MPGVAGEVKVIFSADTASYTASVRKAKEQLGVFEGSAKTAGATARREMNEARGSIMVLGEEIGVHLPRHVQRFVAGLPGVSTAMSAAFNAVAVIAIGEAVFEAGKKVIEFVEKNEEAARKNAKAWEDSRLKLIETNDELDLANAKLANQIDVLEHKPENKLAEALIEARVETDKLDDRLQAAIKDAQTLLEKQSAGFLKSLFTGANSTGYETTMLEQHSRWVEDSATMADKLSESKRFADSLQTRLDELKKLNVPLPQSPYAGANSIGAIGVGSTMQRDYQPEIDAVQELQRRQKIEQAYISGSITESTLTGRKDQLLGAKSSDEEARRAATQRMEVAHHALDAMKADHEVSYQEEADYWQKLADSVKRGSLVYVAALDEANKARAAGWKQYQAGLFQGWMTDKRRDDRENPNLTMPAQDAVGQTWSALQRQNDESVNKTKENAIAALRDTSEAIKATEKQEEESIKLLLDRGVINAHEAAIQTQAVHAESFASWTKASGAFSAQFPELPTPGGAATMSGYESQAEKDRYEVNATSALGEFTDRLRETTQHFTDLGEKLSSFTAGTLESFNATLLKTLSTPASMLRGTHPWRNLGGSVARSAGGAALQFGEGSLMKAIPGLDKLFPKKGDGYHMWVDNLPGATPGAGLTSFLGKGGIGGGIMSAIGGIASAVHIPGFAEGGMIPSNMPVMVGENGPEILAGVGGRSVIPNDQIGGGDTHIHIDARESNDPAATEAAAHRAMAVYMPYMPGMARAAVADQKRRMPGMLGR